MPPCTTCTSPADGQAPTSPPPPRQSCTSPADGGQTSPRQSCTSLAAGGQAPPLQSPAQILDGFSDLDLEAVEAALRLLSRAGYSESRRDSAPSWFAKGAGLCANLDYLLGVGSSNAWPASADWILPLALHWGGHSGVRDFPVPPPLGYHSTAERLARSPINKWVGNYGKARLDLLTCLLHLVCEERERRAQGAEGGTLANPRLGIKAALTGRATFAGAMQ